VSALEKAVALLGHLQDRMRHLQPSMGSLIHGACGAEAFAQLSFLRECDGRMGRGQPFPVAWRESLEAFQDLEGEPREILLELGEVLGASELEAALSALDFARRRMELQLNGAREHRDKYQKLYRTMGVLSGFAIVLILL